MSLQKKKKTIPKSNKHNKHLKVELRKEAIQSINQIFNATGQLSHTELALRS